MATAECSAAARTSNLGRSRAVAWWTAQESQMPKIKTKSGAKKRFKVTGGGKVLLPALR